MEKTNSLPLNPPKTLENQLITYGKIPLLGFNHPK
jgi:hypothetical protein